MEIPSDQLKMETWPPKEDEGGQTVGNYSTGVRIEHTPTGTVAISINCRSQHKNRTVALEMIEWALSSRHVDWK